MAYTEEELWNMSDEELDAAFAEEKMNGGTAEEKAPEEEFDEEVETTDEVDNDNEEVLEQPEEDSDDDSSDEEEEEESEEDSETDEDELDGESETEEEQTDEDEEESDKEEQPARDDEVLNFRANGQDYNFTVKEMKEQFGKVFGQAMDYTKKMQQIKPYRKTIDALESANVSQEDLNMMIDALSGNKEALAAVMKRTGVDALDLATEEADTYVPKDYGRNETELAIRDVIDEISVDKEYAITHNILEKQWDDKSRDAFVADPNLIKLLHVDVKNGMFDTISPIANKMKVYDGGKQSDLDYYKAAAREYFNQQAQEESRVAEQAKMKEGERQRIAEVKAKQEQAKATKAASKKRRAAAPTKKASTSKASIDFLDDSDEGFEEWYKQLQDRQ